MTRRQQNKINQKVINEIKPVVNCFHIPAYKTIVATLNNNGYRTSRGNPWTPHRLFRMLQRNQISGLWGLKKGVFPHVKKGVFRRCKGGASVALVYNSVNTDETRQKGYL